MRRRNRLSYVLAGLLLGLVSAVFLVPGGPVAAQTGTPAAVPTEPILDDERNTVQIVEQRGPSVVAINVEVRGTRVNPFDEIERLFPNFFPPQFREQFQTPQVQQSSGSGFVVSADELVTNYHVVQGALQEASLELREGASLRVVFPGSTEEFDVRVVGANPDFDLALLQLQNGNNIPESAVPLEIADSSTAQVGQKVVAIGNPFGLQSSVSQGIISAIGRELPSIGRVEIPMIQTDAAINPGNSGGPLLDSAGRLIGINTMIVPGVTASGSAGSIGIGFAVPSELLLEALPMMRSGGLVGTYATSLDIENRPRIGVEVYPAAAYPERAREVLGMPDYGMVVAAVEQGGPADEAGIMASTFTATIDEVEYPAGGDVILAANGTEIREIADLHAQLADATEGDQLELEVWRGGEIRTVSITLRVVPITQPEAR